MDGRTNERTNGWTHKQTNGWTDRQMVGRTNIDGRTEEYTDHSID